MAGGSRTIRGETAEKIRQMNQHFADEIARVERDKNLEIKRLQEETEKKLRAYQKQLDDLEKKHKTMIASAKADVAARMDEEERLLRKKMTDLRNDMAARIREQQHLCGVKIEKMRIALEAEINRIWKSIDKIAEDERTLAEDSVREAQEKLTALSRSAEVRDFGKEVYNGILIPLVEDSEALYEQGNWQAAAHKAILAQLECRRCRLDAEQKKAAWDRRVESVSLRLASLKTHLNVMCDENYRVAVTGNDWHGCLRTWTESSDRMYGSFKKRLDDADTVLRKIQPGLFDMLDTMEIDLSDLSRNRVIDNYISELVEQIRCCLLAYGLLLSFEEIPGSDWGPAGEASLDRDNLHLQMVLENSRNELLESHVIVDQKMLKRGQPLIRFRTVFHSSRPQTLINADLSWFMDALERAVNSPEYGYLTRSMRSPFTDRNGYPGMILEFVPDMFVSSSPSGSPEGSDESDEDSGSVKDKSVGMAV